MISAWIGAFGEGSVCFRCEPGVGAERTDVDWLSGLHKLVLFVRLESTESVSK